MPAAVPSGPRNARRNPGELSGSPSHPVRELKRLKARIKTELIMQQESSFSRSSSIAREWYHINRARTLDELEQIVDGLTCQSINDYLGKHPPGQFTIVTVGPDKLQIKRLNSNFVTATAEPRQRSDD